MVYSGLNRRNDWQIAGHFLRYSPLTPRFYELFMNFDNIIVDTDGPVAVATLNRPKQLNALSYGLCKDLCLALEELDGDDSIRVFIITGSERVFAAGADINEMVEATPFAGKAHERLAFRDRINHLSKPMIAAVSGFALGGGCELAMSCDIIIASESAVFGQPELNLGTIPGSGGTQRLTRLVGKHKAMELVLTGRFMNAAEAERCGLGEQGRAGGSAAG